VEQQQQSGDQGLAALPAFLRDALARELDPGERVVWAGMPDGRRVFRNGLPGAFGAAGTVTVIATLSGLAVFAGSEEARGVPEAARELRTVIIVASLIGVVLATMGLAVALGPFVHRRRARRTVYAVTLTRVLRVILKTDGRAHVTQVEPGHPLAIMRKDHTDGTGEIYLYPSPRPQGGPMSASLHIEAVHEPRTVDRAIRATFDPHRAA